MALGICLLKLRNEDLSDLHEVLNTPILKTDVRKHQLQLDVGLLTSEAVQKGFGVLSHISVISADQAEMVKFLP